MCLQKAAAEYQKKKRGRKWTMDVKCINTTKFTCWALSLYEVFLTIITALLQLFPWLNLLLSHECNLGSKSCFPRARMGNILVGLLSTVNIVRIDLRLNQIINYLEQSFILYTSALNTGVIGLYTTVRSSNLNDNKTKCKYMHFKMPNKMKSMFTAGFQMKTLCSHFFTKSFSSFPATWHNILPYDIFMDLHKLLHIL